MRLHHIDYLRLLRVVQEGTHVAHDIVVIEVTKPYGRSGLEAPDGEPVVCLMVTNDVARPRGFRYLVYWREKWWHDMVHADTKDNLRIYLEPIERARRVERAACRWARENVRLG